MHKRSSTKDENAVAYRIVDAATRKGDDSAGRGKPKKRKNPAAVALGRLGGRKGGPARARLLSSARRTEIARLAAQARWGEVEE